MKTEQLAVVQGWADTRRSLRRWNAAPASVLAPWALASLAVAVLLLAATWLIATLSTPDPSGAEFPGVTYRATVDDYGFVLFRNGLVLALHSLACVAGFMAGSSLPQVAEGYNGVWRRIHELAGPLAIGFVALATLFSLFTQAYALGGHASTFAGRPRRLPARARARHPPARAARAVRAVPAARGMDARQPRRPLGGAARRDLRHDGPRDPDPAARGRRRGVGLARACCWPWRASTRRYTF